MPFQAVAWAWNLPVASAEERGALIWLANKADESGLVSPLVVPDMAVFLQLEPGRCWEIVEDLAGFGYVSKYYRDDGPNDFRGAAILNFPITADWDEETGRRPNRKPLPLDVRQKFIRRATERRHGDVKDGCFACGSMLDLQVDHIFPRAEGGLNVDQNLQVLCADCNRRKSARLGWVAL